MRLQPKEEEAPIWPVTFEWCCLVVDADDDDAIGHLSNERQWELFDIESQVDV